jgi:hypothetical protein
MTGKSVKRTRSGPRLFVDSIEKKRKQVMKSRFERSPMEETEWKLRLGATHHLTSCLFGKPTRPISAISVCKSTSQIQEYSLRLDVGCSFASFPGKKMPVKLGLHLPRVRKAVIPKDAREVFVKRAEMKNPVSDASSGVKPFLSPSVHMTGSEPMIPVISPITVFYDRQGTY